jgi:hypothetical protein
MDPDSDPDSDGDPDPYIFITDLQDANKKLIFKEKFFCILLCEGIFHHFLKVKSQKEVAKQQKSRFFLLFLLNARRIRNGSGSMKPKNTWIRIRNIAFLHLVIG